MAKVEPQELPQTMEDYLLSQLQEPAILKCGGVMTRADGTPMTKNEVIATTILNNAMNGDLKAAQYIQGIQTRAQLNKKRK